MKKKREQEIGKAIQRLGYDQVSPDFTDMVMMQIQAELQEETIEDSLMLAIKERMVLDQAPKHLTNQVLHQLEQIPSGYRPLLTRRQQLSLGILLVLLSLLSYLLSSGSSSFASPNNSVADNFLDFIADIPPITFWLLLSTAILIGLENFIRKRLVKSEAKRS